MSFHILILLVLLIFVAIFFRIDFIVYLLYVLAGVYLLALLWTRHALRTMSIHRSYHDHAFLGEDVQVQLTVRNRSLLPIPWVRIEDSLPLALGATPLRTALLMAPRQMVHLSYQFAGHRRGMYAIGPTLIRAGDLFGFEEPPQRSGPAGHITVYPADSANHSTRLALPLPFRHHRQQATYLSRPVSFDGGARLPRRRFVAPHQLEGQRPSMPAPDPYVRAGYFVEHHHYAQPESNGVSSPHPDRRH